MVLRLSAIIAACPAARADLRKSGIRSRASATRDTSVMSNASATSLIQGLQMCPVMQHRDQKAGCGWVSFASPAAIHNSHAPCARSHRVGRHSVPQKAYMRERARGRETPVCCCKRQIDALVGLGSIHVRHFTAFLRSIDE
jgi:hypothetical protein